MNKLEQETRHKTSRRMMSTKYYRKHMIRDESESKSMKPVAIVQNAKLASFLAELQDSWAAPIILPPVPGPITFMLIGLSTSFIGQKEENCQSEKFWNDQYRKLQKVHVEMEVPVLHFFSLKRKEAQEQRMRQTPLHYLMHRNWLSLMVCRKSQKVGAWRLWLGDRHLYTYTANIAESFMPIKLRGIANFIAFTFPFNQIALLPKDSATSIAKFCRKING